MLAAGREFDGSGAAEGLRVMILRSGRDTDHNGFGIAADVDPVDLALSCSGEAVKRGANGHGHGVGAADARARGSFRIGRERKAALRLEELGNFREEREAIALGIHERGERGKTFFALDVAGNQLDAVVAAGMRLDDARGVSEIAAVTGTGPG